MKTILLVSALIYAWLSTPSLLLGQQVYTFTKIADSAADSSFTSFSGVALNNSGIVAFGAQRKDTASSPREIVIYTGQGGDLTRIAGSSGAFNLLQPSSINNRGAVAFGAVLDDGTTGLYIGSGGDLTVIETAATPDFHPTTVSASINDEGELTYVTPGRVTRLTKGVKRVLASTTTGTFGLGLFTPAQLNNTGLAVFFAGDNTLPGTNLYSDSSGKVSPLLGGLGIRTNQLNYFDTPSVNDGGEILFVGTRWGTDPLHYRLAKYANGRVTDLLIIDGPSVFSPQINNVGGIAFFRAAVNSGTMSIVAGTDLVKDKVIGTGDDLFGSKVRVVGTPVGPGRYLNDRGEIAFIYQLESGVLGVAVAKPSGGIVTPAVTANGIVPVFSSATTIQVGSWISIYGNNLAEATAIWNGDFPISLGGVTVTIDSKPAYLWFVSPNQINLQVPDGVNNGPATVVITTPRGTTSATATIGSYGPSFSLLDSKYPAAIVLSSSGAPGNSGGGYDLIGPNGAFSFATRPVKPGETLILYGVGFGPTNPPVAAGRVFSGAAPTTSLPQISIGGTPATVSFAGMIQAGLYQFNVVVPNVGAGDQLLRATIGGASTPNNIFVSVQ